MAWSDSHSICDVETARRACGNSLIADSQLGMGTSDITSVTVAQAAATTNMNNRTLVHLCDLAVVQQCPKAFRVGYNMGATFGSTFAAYQASLPDSTGHERQLYS